MMATKSAPVVLIEENPDERRGVQEILEQAGYRIYAARDFSEGLILIHQHAPRLVITDICQRGSNGLDLLSSIKELQQQIMVLVITAYGSFQQAVDAIRLGACDFLYKPFSREHLLFAVYKAFASEDFMQETRTPEANGSYNGHCVLLGKSQRIQVVHEQIKRMAGSSAPVLLLGESGTGKELAAKLLHSQSERSKGPFIPVNCASIPGNLLESELFGHVRGSFTGAVRDHKGKFEQADGGTLFLDEIGELPLELQPKLLRALQEQEYAPIGGKTKVVDVRVVAATNSNLEVWVDQGRFRSDLYYRLAVLPLTLPALRERTEDVGLLAQHFLDRYSVGRQVQLSNAAIAVLQNYTWPGNVRELQNLMERLAVLSGKELIEPEDIPVQLISRTEGDEPCVVNLPPGGFPLRDIECQAIRQALIATSGNLSKAAEFLNVPRHILAYRVDKYGINAYPAR